MGFLKWLFFGRKKALEESREISRRYREENEKLKAEVRAEADQNYHKIKEAFESEIKEKEEKEWQYHPANIPYLNRLKRELKILCSKLVAEEEKQYRQRSRRVHHTFVDNWIDSKDTNTFESKFYQAEAKRDEYFIRINNIVTENYQAEVMYLEGEIKKLNVKIKEYEKNLPRGSTPEAAAEMETLFGLANMFGVSNLFGIPSIPQIKMQINDYELATNEVKSLGQKTPTKTEKQKEQEKLAKIQMEISEIRTMMKKKMEQADDEAEKRKHENRYGQIIDELEEDESKIRKRIAIL